jgi:hypothetical protein
MELTFVPLLRIQRDLYTLPRGMDRFRSYIRTMVDASTGDLSVPLVAMNPMAREHVPALLDDLLGIRADDIGQSAVTLAGHDLADEPGRFKVGLVVADDVRGAWTNRYAAEFSHRFEETALYKRGWIVGVLWASELPTEHRVRETVLTAIYRASHVQQHGTATTLAEMLAQEGRAMARAGCVDPALDADDLAYTRAVIAPLLAATERATTMACLFGDAAAGAFGYAPQGLSPRAGLALALHDHSEPRRAIPTSRG